jgi:hypothetical protein
MGDGAELLGTHLDWSAVQSAGYQRVTGDDQPLVSEARGVLLLARVTELHSGFIPKRATSVQLQ